MQSTDFEWFKANIDALYDEYGPTFLAIKDEKVLGAYESYGEGVRSTMENEQLGTFIVQRCDRGEEAYTNYIASTSFYLVDKVV